VRDSSGKPGAVGNREDLERIARPEGARPTMCKARMPAANASRMSSTGYPITPFELRSRNKTSGFPITQYA